MRAPSSRSALQSSAGSDPAACRLCRLEKTPSDFFGRLVRFCRRTCLASCRQRQKVKENMNKKLIVMLAAVATAGMLFARPGPGFHGGRGPGGFRGPSPTRGPGIHHHHHHGGWGVAGAVLGTAALVNDIVRPAPAVVTTPVYAPAPVVTTYAAPAVAHTYAAPPPMPPPPPRVCYRPW